MTYVQTVEPEELRVILSLEFEQHADPTEVVALKQDLIASPNTLHGVETTGSFGLMVEVAASTLARYHEWLRPFAAPLARVVKRCEASFVCRRFIRRPKDDPAIWVPIGETLKRIDGRNIDKVTAERDYVRIYVGEQNWLLHATLHSVAEKLGSRDFVQVHRSMLLRRQFIQELRRVGNHWLACLRDGTTQRVAKSHVAETLAGTRLDDHTSGTLQA